jgi:phosphonate transport system ATP-binding protein
MQQIIQEPLKLTAIEVKDLIKLFDGKLTLRRVNFSVTRGEMIALVGASGSGKSTLLRTINGLELINLGCIEIFGTPLQTDGVLHSKVRHLRSQIGFIFQQFNLVNRLTVLDNVLMGKLSQVSLARSAFRWFTSAEKEQVLAALERVGILDQAYQRVDQLSGGQQQRVAIARCLMQGARIILADEPIASLDAASAHRIMELLASLNQDQGMTVIVSSHQIPVVQRYFQRAIALKDGEIQFDGKTMELSHTQLNQIYGASVEELVFRS